MLRKANRFHGYNSLNFVHQKGQLARVSGMSLKYARNNRLEQCRVAVVVSKKVSKSAVTRNRIRRRIFETVRTQATLQNPYDLVFMVYDVELATVPAVQLQTSVRRLLEQAGLI